MEWIRFYFTILDPIFTLVTGKPSVGLRSVLIVYSITYHIGVRIAVSFSLCSDLGFDGLSDGQLTGSLTDLGQICTTESMCHFSQVIQIHILVNTIWQ